MKDHYVLGRPIPRYSAIVERLAKVERSLEAARSLTRRAAWMADKALPTPRRPACRRRWRARPRSSLGRGHRDRRRGGLYRKDRQLLEKWFRDIKVYDVFEGTGATPLIVVSKRLISDLESF